MLTAIMEAARPQPSSTSKSHEETPDMEVDKTTEYNQNNRTMYRKTRLQKKREKTAKKQEKKTRTALINLLKVINLQSHNNTENFYRWQTL
ncbi:hypothetical protein RCL_jg24950.t1 [Rhizophagus clarus]|uniref:Uncharacterized protein n=1 Tax=Rhizophagus clarus TaxID=94130 RepID=A0A8H3LS97_9GLOM|nr:hypothetical protein RCL_jg24950.t1 [Rhizophagus clarus]